jgi:ABC-type phosphate transport system substrate-binding protein
MDGYLALLGETEIKVIVNSSSTLQNLTLEEIKTIFRKGTTASGQPLQVWILQDDEVRPNFDAVVLNGEEAASQARIAPDPAAMLEAVSSDPTAIGYLPATWLNDEVRPLVLDLGLESALSQKLRLPILALAKVEPQGVSRTLLGCLQSPAGAPK